MMKFILGLLLTACVSHADPASLAWWLLPEASEDLPHEIDEDNSSNWSELWVRSQADTQVQPSTVMENSLGARWIGSNPDESGKPSTVYLIMGQKRVVQFTGEQVRTGNFDGEKITWSDGKKENMTAFKRHRRGRRKHSAAKINFGKIALPSMTPKVATLPPWSMEGLEKFLFKITGFSGDSLAVRDLSIMAQLSDPNGSVLGFRYSNSCELADRKLIEDAMAAIEPQLTCWMSQNPEESWKIPAILLQKPVIECRSREPMTSEHCAMATLPLVDEFFVAQPKITLSVNHCRASLANTLLHETLHLTGLKDDTLEFDKAMEQSASCSVSPAKLSYKHHGERFFNDFQVDTRMFLFGKARQDAIERWGWTEGERAFFLGAICKKMGDKFCARRYFQTAAQGGLTGMIELPEGGEIPLATLAQFEFYDSISEDLQRMHELAHYLRRDPNGTLLRRQETGVHRVHEFFVARTALQAIQENKGVCNGEIDDHVMCEDLAEIIKSPWFKN